MSAESFKRLTGVKCQTFEKMTGLIEEALAKKKIIGDRPNKLAVEERLLMILKYLREYRVLSQFLNCSFQIIWMKPTLK